MGVEPGDFWGANGSYGSAAVGSGAAVQVAEINGSRRSILFQNRGSEEGYVGFDEDVEPSTGVAVAASASIFYDDYQGEVWWITASGDIVVVTNEVEG